MSRREGWENMGFKRAGTPWNMGDERSQEKWRAIKKKIIIII